MINITLVNETRKDNIFYHSGIKELELYDLFLKMDFAITSGGVIIKELATCGVPSIAILQADNQIDNINNLLIQGLIGYAGKIGSKIFERNLEEQIFSYHNFHRRKEIHDRCISVLDGSPN